MANFETAIVEALAKSAAENGTLDAQKVTDAFIASIEAQDELDKIMARLDVINNSLRTGNIITTTVTADVEGAKARLIEWNEKRQIALAKDVAVYEKAIKVFVAAAGAAATVGSGGLSAPALLPIVTSLISAFGPGE